MIRAHRNADLIRGWKSLDMPRPTELATGRKAIRK
jgi:hypothetical protein